MSQKISQNYQISTCKKSSASYRIFLQRHLFRGKSPQKHSLCCNDVFVIVDTYELQKLTCRRILKSREVKPVDSVFDGVQTGRRWEHIKVLMTPPSRDPENKITLEMIFFSMGLGWDGKLVYLGCASPFRVENRWN